MKLISQISKETGVEHRELYRVMRLQNITPNKEGKFIKLDPFQEDLIHQYLYYSGKFQELTIESKMNIPEKKMTLTEFKKINYGLKN